MKKVMIFAMLLASATSIWQGCTADQEDWTNQSWNGQQGNNSTGTASGSSGDISDVATFDIALNENSLSESEQVDTDNEDYVENSTFDTTVAIAFANGSATATNVPEGVTVTSDGADVVVSSTIGGVAYELSGTTTDGSLKIYSDKKLKLVLRGVSITNPTGAAINIQSKKRVFVVLADGSNNNLTDGTTYSDATDGEDMKACLFSEGQLIFSGAGRLNVYGYCKAGIRSDDYVVIRPNTNLYVKATAGNGIKGNDALSIYGGVVNVEVSGTAAKALSTDGHALISGGRTTLLVTGGATYDSDEQDVVGSAGLKADSTFTLTGGELYVKNTGKGGKGISTDMQTYVKGGTLGIITTGSTYSYSGKLDSKAKGLKADGDLAISGGTVKVRTTGGNGSEGIESKGTITISDGSVQVQAYDDAINSKSHLYIKGGSVYANSTGNDGLDSNGNTYIQGGTTVAYGTRQPECGIDANEEGGYSVCITGGNLFAIGGGNSTPSGSNSTQGYVTTSGSISAGTTATLANGSQTMATFTLPASYSNGSILATAQGMTAGSSYTLSIGSSAVTLTASQYGTTGMGGGGMQGGPGGGRW